MNPMNGATKISQPMHIHVQIFKWRCLPLHDALSIVSMDALYFSGINHRGMCGTLHVQYGDEQVATVQIAH